MILFDSSIGAEIVKLKPPLLQSDTSKGTRYDVARAKPEKVFQYKVPPQFVLSIPALPDTELRSTNVPSTKLDDLLKPSPQSKADSSLTSGFS